MYTTFILLHFGNANLRYIILLSVYSPFSDRVGLPLHNIPSPFLSFAILDVSQCTEEYILRCYVTLVKSTSKVVPQFNRHVTTLKQFLPNFSHFCSAVTEKKNIKNCVFVEQVRGKCFM